MATCIQSINSVTPQPISLSNNVAVEGLSNSTVNGMFSLSSSMDQSIFLNMNIIGGHNSINLSLTIYKKDTLQIFGTMNITRSVVNSSFNILAGEYYICVRSLIVEYKFELTASFINYVTVQLFSPTSTYGFQSDSILTSKQAEVNCKKPLLYKMIDGILPTGIIMLENGYVNGTLPMLDTEEYNKDLPTSNLWYEQIHDNEYVTSWGRIYRFKVHLYLEGFYDKGVDRWFYISIVNDFNKNLRYVDQYMLLEDERIVTFEDQIKLNNIRLCPIPDGESSTIEEEKISENNLLYLKIESNYTSDDERTINEIFDDYMYDGQLRTEMIILDKEHIQFYKGEPQFPSSVGNNGLIEWYLENINDLDNIVIVQLKDSCMFQNLLIENNVDEIVIDYDASQRFDFKNITLIYEMIDDIHYIKMMNNYGVEDGNIVNSVDVYNDLYKENFRELPYTLYTMYGFGMEVILT